MGIPLHVICYFSFAAFNTFSLHSVFANCISMGLGMLLPVSVLYGTLHFLDLGGYFFSQVRKVFDCSLFKYFFSYPISFSSSSSSGIPIIWVLAQLILSQKSLRLSSFFFSFHSSYFFCHSTFQFTCPFFCLLFCAHILNELWY